MAGYVVETMGSGQWEPHPEHTVFSTSARAREAYEGCGWGTDGEGETWRIVEVDEEPDEGR